MDKKEVIKEVKQFFSFQHNFTEAELKEKSRELARACDERTKAEDEKKKIQADFKAKIDGKNAEINIISGHINSGWEYVSKNCDVIFDFPKGIKKFYFEGECVGEEKTTSADHQLHLPLNQIAEQE